MRNHQLAGLPSLEGAPCYSGIVLRELQRAVLHLDAGGIGKGGHERFELRFGASDLTAGQQPARQRQPGLGAARQGLHRLFGNLTESRVSFTVGRDIDLVPRQKGPALNFFVYPYVEVDGQPYAAEKIKRHFSFEDVQ